MRLGQLARKLAIRPTEIAEFLSKENIQLEAGSNTRLEDDQVIYLVKRFAPAMVDAIKAELKKEEVVEEEKVAAPAPIVAEPIIESSPMTDTVILQQEIEIPTPLASIEIIDAVAPENDNNTLTEEDIIRAPKVELPGLKVLGKIEIPEPKKKEVQPLAEEAPADENAVSPEEPVVPRKEVAPVRERRPYQDKRRDFKHQNDSRQRRNPIALQREKEEDEARQKREEAAKLEKERRTLHYMKKVKVVTPIRTNAFIDEPSEKKVAKAETPTSLWGRFKSWLKS